MILNESTKKWSNIITEELGIQDKSKLGWMSNYAAFHEIYEGLQSVPNADAGIYATPLNTIGMGNPAAPLGVGFNPKDGAGIGNTGADFHNPAYKVGSGDALPMSTLPIALSVAAMTIALELVPVIQSNAPWYMLSYMDFPYAGGKLSRFNETAMDGKGPGAHNKPIYIKVSTISKSKLLGAITYDGYKNEIPVGSTVVIASNGDKKLKLVGKFMGYSRIDSNLILEVLGVKIDAEDGYTDKYSIADVFDDAKVEADVQSITLDSIDGKPVGNVKLGDAVHFVRPDFVATMTDHLPEFANFFNGSKDLMTRAQNETGVGNTIGARMYSKLVQMGSIEVTGTVTRQQLQDMPLYGVDVIGKVLEAMQNELSQHINKDILTRLFKLGVTNALEIFEAQGANLNLFVAADPGVKSGYIPAGTMIGIDDADHSNDFGPLPNAHIASVAENITTFQRRIMSRVLAASNLIAQVGRRGRANWVVTNTQIVSALQDAANFVVAPMVNTLTQDGSQSLYFAGSLAGLNIYVDPYMSWDDTRVLVGKKGDGNCPGVIFMPYILADSIQTTVEGTMAPKLLLNSRYAVVDAGFYPETAYYCFYVKSAESLV